MTTPVSHDPTIPVIYIAGPYASPDPVLNTHKTVKLADRLFSARVCYPFVPHITLLWHAIAPRQVNDWYELDLAHMLRCDAVIRLPGDSSGSDRELEVAIEAGLPVYRISHQYEQGGIPVEPIRRWVQQQGFRPRG